VRGVLRHEVAVVCGPLDQGVMGEAQMVLGIRQ
jgi:hypothetical protein